MTLDKERLRVLAEAMPAWDWDSNQRPFYNDPDGNSRGGDCDGTYAVYAPAFQIDDETYDGPVLSERCGRDEAEFICEAAPAVLALLSENAALAAEVERLRKTLEVTTAVAITMLFDSHREDVKRVFTVDELEQVVAATEPLQSMNVQTEEIYRSAWDAIRADKGGAPS